MTKEDLLNRKNHSLRMKDLREFVKENAEIDDSAPVLVERVEDFYFEGREHNGVRVNGWNVLKVEGYHYYNSLEWNKKMQAEIERREKGEEPDYDLENPSDNIFAEKELEEMKEQFYQPHCLTTDKEIIYIYSHY